MIGGRVFSPNNLQVLSKFCQTLPTV